MNWPKPSKRDVLRALQACYYVLHISIVSDTEFDQLQREWEETVDKKLPVGSDQKESYTDSEWSLALYFAMRKAWEDLGFKGSRIPPMSEGKRPHQAAAEIVRKSSKQSTFGFVSEKQRHGKR